MPVFRTVDVAAEPVVFLSPWKVFQLADGSIHLCGGVGFFGGRVSSAVVSFDYEKATAKTITGRTYELTGRPGVDTDAAYVWQQWSAGNAISSWVDVTDEVWEKIEAEARRQL